MKTFKDLTIGDDFYIFDWNRFEIHHHKIQDINIGDSGHIITFKYISNNRDLSFTIKNKDFNMSCWRTFDCTYYSDLESLNSHLRDHYFELKKLIK